MSESLLGHTGSDQTDQFFFKAIDDVVPSDLHIHLLGKGSRDRVGNAYIERKQQRVAQLLGSRLTALILQENKVRHLNVIGTTTNTRITEVFSTGENLFHGRNARHLDVATADISHRRR